MIPLRDANPTRRTPWVTWTFIALNILAFALWQPRGGCDEFQRTGAGRQACEQEIAFTFCYGAIPQELTTFQPIADGTPRTQNEALAAQAEQIGCPDKSVPFSLFSSMFLHGGLLHIGGNMLYLWIFGNNVEDRMGPAIYALFYLAGGLIATYAQVATNSSSAIPQIGASGAIAAVLGAYIVLYPHARVLTAVLFFFITLVEIPAVIVLGLWFVLQAFQGVGSLGTPDLGGTAWFAHIGGFLFGAAVAWLFYRQ
ncbi:MAG TPA: rhomboid family intramembrane serine protease, partial [Actinomycetota bacterium]|nr:rhomboid family intramembrane serine protease [Actinomycetota bacterium]